MSDVHTRNKEYYKNRIKCLRKNKNYYKITIIRVISIFAAYVFMLLFLYTCVSIITYSKGITKDKITIEEIKYKYRGAYIDMLYKYRTTNNCTIISYYQYNTSMHHYIFRDKDTQLCNIATVVSFKDTLLFIYPPAIILIIFLIYIKYQIFFINEIISSYKIIIKTYDVIGMV